MLSAGKSRPIARPIDVKLPSLLRFKAERSDFERFNGAPAVQLISRDAFVADMVVKLDQLQAEIKTLTRDLEVANVRIASLREDTDRNDRFSAFQEGQQRAKAEKIDNVLRRFKDLKTRLDSIDGKSNGDYHAYTNFELISKRLTELGSLQQDFRDVERKLKISAGFFCGSILLWMAALVSW